MAIKDSLVSLIFCYRPEVSIDIPSWTLISRVLNEIQSQCWCLHQSFQGQIIECYH